MKTPETPQYSMDHMLQHIQHDSPFDYEKGGQYLHSGQVSAYGTPEPMEEQYLLNPFHPGPYAEIQEGNVGLGIQYVSSQPLWYSNFHSLTEIRMPMAPFTMASTTVTRNRSEIHP